MPGPGNRAWHLSCFPAHAPTCAVGRLSVPFRPLPGPQALSPHAPHPQACHCETPQGSWQSVSPQAAGLRATAPPFVTGEAQPKDLMHRSFRAGTLLRKILRLWLRMTSEGCGSYFIAIIMCFHTTINERSRLSSARRSRRISCSGASVSEPFYTRSFAFGSG